MMIRLSFFSIYFICFFTCVYAESIKMHNVIQKPFLVQTGVTLANQKVVLPEYFHGKITFIAYGFSRKSQLDIDTWLIPFKQKFQDNEAVYFMEIPMIGTKYRLIKGIIDRGMRSGIDQQDHDNVMSYYGQLRPYIEYYGVTVKERGYFLLLDSRGTIVWQAEGNATEESLKTLFQIVIKMLE